MAEGVTFTDPASCSLSEATRFGRDVVVEPQCHFRGNTNVGDGCHIGPGSLLENAQVGSGVQVLYSVVRQASVGDHCSIGHIALDELQLRPRTGSRLCIVCARFSAPP